MIPSILVSQDRWQSEVLRDAARAVNLVAILARVHGRPEAREFLARLAQALAPYASGRSLDRTESGRNRA